MTFNKFILSAGLLAIASCCFSSVWAQSDIDFSAEPYALVTQVSNVLFDNIREKRELYEENPELLKHLVRENFLPLVDRRRSARLILGREGRGQPTEKIDAFADALINQLLDRFSSGLLEFDSRDQVQVLPLRGELNERQTKIQTRIKLNNGTLAPVDYILRKTDNGWKTFDVIIEGISYVSTYRNQFGEEIRRQGFDKTLQRLQSGDLPLDHAADS